MAGAPVAALQRVPLFSELSPGEVQQIALLFKERHFAAGETVVKEGSDGAAFFLIDSGRPPCRWPARSAPPCSPATTSARSR